MTVGEKGRARILVIHDARGGQQGQSRAQGAGQAVAQVGGMHLGFGRSQPADDLDDVRVARLNRLHGCDHMVQGRSPGNADLVVVMQAARQVGRGGCAELARWVVLGSGRVDFDHHRFLQVEAGFEAGFKIRKNPRRCQRR